MTIEAPLVRLSYPSIRIIVKQKTHGTESVDPVPSTVEQTQADATDGKYSLERPNTVLVTPPP